MAKAVGVIASAEVSVTRGTDSGITTMATAETSTTTIKLARLADSGIVDWRGLH